MQPGIILDFNRTLYNPDADELMPGVRELLDALRDQRAILFLVSAAAPSRQALIARLGLAPYFTDIIITMDKSVSTFRQIHDSHQADPWIVIGDRIRREITYGNAIGATTIWVRQGKFAEELPIASAEEPNYTVSSLAEVGPIITSIMSS